MREFDLIAVLEGRHPAPPLPDLQMIVQGDLTAVLSATPRPPMHAPQSLPQSLPIRPPQSLRLHLQDAADHLSRQTACMYLAPLLPVRLDTPLARDAAAAFLTANQPFLSQLLTRYAGMAQVQVTVSWQEDKVLARFGTEPDLAGFDTSAMGLGRAVQQMALRLSARIGADLARVATELAPLPLAPGLVYSAVVLLPLRRLPDLTRVLEATQAIWPQCLQIRQIGPDPVTSFATLDLSPVTPRQIDQALSAFGLTSLAQLGQLASARRRRLMSASRFDDAALRDEVSDQAGLLAAAARLQTTQGGFAMCRIWQDGRVAPQPNSRAVA